jgi:HAD superfamily hydrolase (TIGR01549 family)
MKNFPYNTVIFDCDGVLLNSNLIKSDAFYEAVLPYGKSYAEVFLKYHIENGGISRDKKFEYFLEKIIQLNNSKQHQSDLLEKYSSLVINELINADVTSGLNSLRQKYIHTKWFVISGGNEEEIKYVFEKKKIAKYFDGGIFGSPKSKDKIFKELIKSNQIKNPAIYLGDSRYDHQVASKYLLDFMFVYGWTEFDDWKNYCEKNGINSIEGIINIIDHFN